MKSKTIWLWILLILLLIISGCSSKDAKSNNQEDDITAVSQTVISNFLVKADGNVLLRRAGWNGFFPINFGTTLKPGDLLVVEKGGAASIFCGDSNTWNEDSFDLDADGEQHGIPCQSGHPPRPWPDVTALRGEENPNIPYVIYPKNSALLSNTPALKWHVLEGIDEYTLSIISDDGADRQEISVQGEKSSWPQEWPPMESNATYALIVEGGGKRSDEGNDIHSGVGFWLLDENTADLISSQVNMLHGTTDSESVKNFLVAQIYINNQLRAEAVQSLEEISNEVEGSSVWVMLGRTLLEIDCFEEAASSFQSALEIANTAGELEIQALAEYGIGLAFQFEKEEELAKSHFEKAREIFEEIGDKEHIKEIEVILQE
ncbi:MAG: tetratricopeptide repeat protein [Anaerolineaceae bacterium]|nr:tetratricopeptide repeat protein [Anaerolineaceae bacterium]